jgi:hypothetical protein
MVSPLQIESSRIDNLLIVSNAPLGYYEGMAQRAAKVS